MGNHELGERTGDALQVPTIDVVGTMSILAVHHAHLDRVFESLLSRGQRGDVQEPRAEWISFEDDLDSHFDLEDRVLLPAFGRQHPEAARALRDEHDVLRASLAELGVALELNCVSALSVQQLITHLRGHASREDSLLYPWAERHLARRAWSEIETEIRRGAEGDVA
jgi:hemerythrin-like domain-containing protein